MAEAQSAYRLPSGASCSRVKARSAPGPVPYLSEEDQAAAASAVAIEGQQQYSSSTKNRGKE